MRILAWAAAVVSLAVVVVSLVVLPILFQVKAPSGVAAVTLAIYGTDDPGARAAGIGLGLTFGAFSALGLVILDRSPSHRMGWILMGIGSTFAVVFGAGAYTVYGLYGVPGGLPGADLVAWTGQWTWIPGWTLLALFLLLFPSGSPISPRWSWVIRGTLAVALVQFVAYSLGEDPSSVGLPVRRPIVIAEAEGALWVLGRIGDLLSAVTFVLAGISLVIRYRRGRGVERQQVKWIAYSTGLLAVGIMAVTVASLVSDPTTAFAVSLLPLSLVFVTLPVSAVFAILRYRLYDIDVVIERTLVYGSLSTVLATSYVAFVVLFQSTLRPFTGGSELAVAGSTLATLALVQPLRQRIQEAVDRRFYRSRYDAARTIEAFTSRLRDEVDLDALRSDLLETISDTVSPAHTAVWLREVRS